MSADEPNPRGWPLTRHMTVLRIARKAVAAAALGTVAVVTQACGGSGASGASRPGSIKPATGFFPRHLQPIRAGHPHGLRCSCGGIK